MSQLFVTLDRFEADKAVLILPDGQNLVLEISQLPTGLQTGDVLKLTFTHDQDQTQKQQALVQKLLTKIQKHETG